MKHRFQPLESLLLFLLPGFILFEMAVLITGHAGLNAGRKAFAGSLDEPALSGLGFVLLVATLAYGVVEMQGRLFFNRVAGKPRPVAPVGVP